MLFAYLLELQAGVTISSNCMPDTTTDIELQWHDQFRTKHNKNIDLSNARDLLLTTYTDELIIKI
jgi:hypothetical protein